jgi:hypothetical protein
MSVGVAPSVPRSSCMQQARKNGLGASGGLRESLRVATGPMRKGLRIARRHTDRYPGAVSSEKLRPQQQ